MAITVAGAAKGLLSISGQCDGGLKNAAQARFV